MTSLQRALIKAAIVAFAMALCVLSVSVLGPIIPWISVVIFMVGLLAGWVKWVSRFRDAAAVLGIGVVLFQVFLAGGLLLIGSGPRPLESCIAYLILTSGVTIVFLWIPFGTSLFLGMLLGRWLEVSKPPPGDQHPAAPDRP